eukprot:c23134_g1_i1 orf=358-1059(-)
METQNGDGELGHRDASSGHPEIKKSSKKVRRALQALESTKDIYAQELSRLKALNEAIPTKHDLQGMEGSPCRSTEPSLCPALLENLLQERKTLSEELQQQKARCNELQRQLEQEFAEKLEAQMCLNVLNETLKLALQGEKFLVEQNRYLVTDQQVLASKLDEVSKARLPAFQTQIKELESACTSIKQEEVVLVLYNKVCVRGLWLFVEFVMFCHAMLWFLLTTLKDTYSFVPT